VLTSFQGVEDNLAALRILEEENGVQDDAVKAARKSVDLTTNQYKAGTVSYLNVITVQTIALTGEITAIQIRGRRMAAAVLLVQARRRLDGGRAPVLRRRDEAEGSGDQMTPSSARTLISWDDMPSSSPYT
jgi:outer membrane protein TolC